MSRAISMDDSYFKVFFPSKKTVGGRSQYTAANPKSDFEYDELIRSFLEELWQEYEHSDLEDVSSKDRIKIIKQALLNDFYERNKTKASSYVVKFLMNDRFIDHLKHLKLVRNQDSKAEVLYDILLGQDDEADTIVDQFFNATSHFEHAAKIKTALTSEDTVFQSTMDNDSYFRPFLTKVRPNSYAILSPSLLEVNAYCNIIIEFFHKISFRYHLNIGKIRGDYEYTEEAHNAQIISIREGLFSALNREQDSMRMSLLTFLGDERFVAMLKWVMNNKKFDDRLEITYDVLLGDDGNGFIYKLMPDLDKQKIQAKKLSSRATTNASNRLGSTTKLDWAHYVSHAKRSAQDRKQRNKSLAVKILLGILFAIGVAAFIYISVQTFGAVPVAIAVGVALQPALWAVGAAAVAGLVTLGAMVMVRYAKVKGWFKSKAKTPPPPAAAAAPLSLAGGNIGKSDSLKSNDSGVSGIQSGHDDITITFKRRTSETGSLHDWTPDTSPARSPAESKDFVNSTQPVGSSTVAAYKDAQFPLRYSDSLRRKWTEYGKNITTDNDAAGDVTSAHAMIKGGQSVYATAEHADVKSLLMDPLLNPEDYDEAADCHI